MEKEKLRNDRNEGNEKKNADRRFFVANTATKVIICLLSLFVIGLLVAVIVLSTNRKDSCGTSRKIPKCPGKSTLRPLYKKSEDLYRDLTELEIIRVRDYVLNEESLNVTSHESARVDSNYIFLIELQNPDKTKAISYLDGDGTKPDRAANVIIFKGAASPPVVEEILVYFSSPMKHEVNTILSGEPISFHSRPVDKLEKSRIDELVNYFASKAHKIMNESYDGYTVHNCTDRCLTYSESGAASIHGSGERHNWIWFLRSVPGRYAHPIGLELLIQREGNDASKWNIEKVYYNKKTFDSVGEFVKSYEQGNVTKVFFPAPKADELLYSTLKRRGEKLQPSSPLREPRQYEPDGKRYTADSNHIEYMGWSFDFRVRSTSGPQFFDIRFNGERIVYELSLQEPTAFYGGYSPMQSYSDYLDSTWAMGSTFELVKGVDCPTTATYFDVVYFVDSAKPSKRRNAICVFEHSTGIPLRRHFDNDFEGGYNFYGGMPGSSLVVRTISTPYNYDYIYDCIFHPNGVIEAKTSTTGYLQTTFWTPEEDDYGTQVHKNVTGSIHDHMLHFKVDLDIAGLNNNFEAVSATIENISSRWFPNKRHIQKRVTRNLKKTEKAAAYKFDFKRPCYLNIYNPAKTNSQGVRRGYRIQLSGILDQLYPESWELTNGFSWSFYQMAVTKYKRTEDRSSSIYNQHDLYKPVVDFRKFIEDDENIVNQDLVAWVSVGLMHIPHSEDIPVTTTTGNSAGFFLRPFNYFDEDPSMASRDSVLITPTAEGSKVDRFGRPPGSSCVPEDEPIKYDGHEL